MEPCQFETWTFYKKIFILNLTNAKKITIVKNLSDMYTNGWENRFGILCNKKEIKS